LPEIRTVIFTYQVSVYANLHIRLHEYRRLITAETTWGI